MRAARCTVNGSAVTGRTAPRVRRWGGGRHGCGAAVGRAVPLRYPCVPNLTGFCIINGTMGTPLSDAYLRGSTCTCGIASRNPDEISSASVETGRPSRRRRGTAPRTCSSSTFGISRSSTSALRSRPPPLPPVCERWPKPNRRRHVPRLHCDRPVRSATRPQRQQTTGRRCARAVRRRLAANPSRLPNRCKREPPVPAIDLGPAFRAR